MIAKLLTLTLISVLVACGEQTVEVGAGEATIENAAAAVIILEGDRLETGEQVSSIFGIEGEVERLPPPDNVRLMTVFTEGEPFGRFYVQVTFQAAVSVEDRQEIADRVKALELDEPIWLGPNDRWPFCRQEPCVLIREDDGFPN